MTAGEPLPGGKDRLLRHGLLAQRLVDEGHDVTWWTSTFDHGRKRDRWPADHTLEIGPRYRIRAFRGGGYAKNVSLARIRDHRAVAHKVAASFARVPKPDLILCSYPTIELASASVRYGHRHAVPVAVDVRDQWPDIFLELVPKPLRPPARLALASAFRDARRTLRGATAILGVTPGMVKWGLARAGRTAGPLDRAFPLAYDGTPPPAPEVEKAVAAWRARRIGLPGSFPVCYFGAFSRHKLALETVLEAARILADRERGIEFVLCGDGDDLDHYRRLAAGARNVHFPGWVGKSEIWGLMSVAAMGLAPYASTPNYVENIPNKPIEYLAGGLPLLSSLQGNVEDLIRSTGCGIAYREDDPRALADKLADIAKAPEALEAMRDAARRIFLERFDAKRVYGEFSAHLGELAKAGGTRLTS